MKRTSLSGGYGFFGGLADKSPLETQDQAALIITHDRVRATIAADRRLETRECWRVRVALLAIAFAVLVLLVGLIDSGNRFFDAPGDHVGPDEIRHARAGRQVVELRSSTVEVAN